MFHKTFAQTAFVALALGASAFPGVQAATLNASLGGTFNMNMDRELLAQSTSGNSADPGHFLVDWFDTAESDYTARTDSSFYFNNSNRTEIPAVNLLHDITPLSASDPAPQAANRYVKSTSPNFSVDSQTLAGTGSLGMTGIELYKGKYNGALIYGDYSLHYNPANRQELWDLVGVSGTPSGWYLQNNVSFSAVVYDLSNLSLLVTDSGNWALRGDLLLSPENAGLIKNTALADAGDFCLGLGSYAGCGQVSAVPVPAGIWLLGSGLGALAMQRRKRA